LSPATIAFPPLQVGFDPTEATLDIPGINAPIEDSLVVKA